MPLPSCSSPPVSSLCLRSLARRVLWVLPFLPRAMQSSASVRSSCHSRLSPSVSTQDSADRFSNRLSLQVFLLFSPLFSPSPDSSLMHTSAERSVRGEEKHLPDSSVSGVRSY